nr:TetR/AcrR family transcriptional regulator [uncultured Chryseobacterium sp.]
MSGINKKSQIIEAAKIIFLDNGFKNTSMDLIADKAKVARRTIYNQFKSKEKLFEEVVNLIWKNLKPYQVNTNDKDPLQTLLYIGQAIANYWNSQDIRDYLRLVIAEGEQFPDLPKLFYAKGKSPMILNVHNYLNELNTKGVLKIDNVELAAKQFFGMINEPFLWMRLIDDTSEISDKEQEKIVSSAVNAFFRAYKN